MLVLIVRVQVKGNTQKTMCSDHERKHYLLNTSDLLGSVPPFLHLLPWFLHFRCQPILWAAHTNYIRTGVFNEYNKGDNAVRVTLSTWILVAGADRGKKMTTRNPRFHLMGTWRMTQAPTTKPIVSQAVSRGERCTRMRRYLGSNFLAASTLS